MDTKSNIRNRNFKSAPEKSSKKQPELKDDLIKFENLFSILKYLFTVIGVCLIYFICVEYSSYLKNLNESKLWFSNIKVK